MTLRESQELAKKAASSNEVTRQIYFP